MKQPCPLQPLYPKPLNPAVMIKNTLKPSALPPSEAGCYGMLQGAGFKVLECRRVSVCVCVRVTPDSIW